MGSNSGIYDDNIQFQRAYCPQCKKTRLLSIHLRPSFTYVWPFRCNKTPNNHRKCSLRQFEWYENYLTPEIEMCILTQEVKDKG